MPAGGLSPKSPKAVKALAQNDSCRILKRQASCHMKPEERKSVGDQELRLLTFLADRGGATVRQTADTWGAERGVVKTTVQQMMERLRSKGYLCRAKREGQYHYDVIRSPELATEGLVTRFVRETLGGSLTPVLLYLRGANLEPAEVEELKQLIRDLEATQ